MPSGRSNQAVKPSARQFLHHFAARRTADAITHCRAGEPTGQSVNVAEDRPEGKNGCDIEDRYGKENKTAQQIGADDKVKCRRLVSYGLLPSDDRSEIDPMTERRPAPDRGQCEEQQQYDQTPQYSDFAGSSGGREGRHVVGASPIIFHRLSLNIKTTPSNIPCSGKFIVRLFAEN